ncbi:hypothetical protein PsYK624_051260 [Phanerochaete sordida]|uniref:Uncharacterized protein n=1 Tax=Phanerochaete sordida TaxID=48140 RepID=A0A9P3LB22_9APHY|nr:hypothetical protein PsYK624_051260 [Phanerochaete sordida]
MFPGALTSSARNTAAGPHVAFCPLGCRAGISAWTGPYLIDLHTRQSAAIDVKTSNPGSSERRQRPVSHEIDIWAVPSLIGLWQ